jgi:replicative DNA helicase
MSRFETASMHQDGDGASQAGAILDRLPPQNLVAEQGVIASVLLNNAAMHEVALILRGPGDFARANHGELYRAIKDLYDAGRPFDVLILAEAMGPRYDLAGGDPAMEEIMGSIPHAANAVYYAKIVREKAVARELVDCAHEMLREGYSNSFTAEQLLEAAERRVFAIAEGEASGETIDAGELMSVAMDRLAAREAGEVTGISTGFADLDDRIDGLQPQTLVIIAARPAIGKSSLAVNIADHVSTAGTSVLFVSLEMSRQDLGERFLCARAEVDGYVFKNPSLLTARDRHALGGANHALRTARLHVDDTPTRTLSQVAANARRIKSRHGLGLLIVDYIQLIEGQRMKGESRQEEVARISKKLKAIARELDVPVIALAQLNREVEGRPNSRPRLSDLRESGQLEADADVVILLDRPDLRSPDDRPGEADLIIAKNRMGACGTIRMVYRSPWTKFVPLAPFAGAAPVGDDGGF